MKIDCPHCGVHGSVDDSLSGRKLRCPKCSKVFLVTDDMVPDTDQGNLVHQEILRDPPETPVAASVEQEPDEDPFRPVPILSNEEKDLEPENEDNKEEEGILAFDDDGDDQDSIVEDDDFLAFAGDEDDLDDTEPALVPENLEICAGCGEALHSQFLDIYEGQQYCALCFPDDAEENLQLSETMETEEEEEIELEADDDSETYLDLETTLMDDDEDEPAEIEEYEDETDTDEEELDEEGFLQEACSVCGDTFHKDFLQEIDSKLYCGVCQPEVIETLSTDVMAAFDDEEEGVAEDIEVVEDDQRIDTDFTVGDTIKEAWQKTKGAKGAVWGGILVMYLIIFGISFAGFWVSGQSDPSTGVVINSGLQLMTSWLSMLFTGGLMLIGVRRALEQRVSWKMVFAAFSGKKILSVSIATFLQLLLIVIGFLLLVLPGIYLTVGYALTLPLILDKGLGPWEALETSRKAIHKKWWTVLGMYLVMMLLYMVAIVPLGLGLIWAVPMFMVLVGVLYTRLFGFSEVEEDEELVEEDDVEDEIIVFEDFAEESEKSL